MRISFGRLHFSIIIRDGALHVSFRWRKPDTAWFGLVSSGQIPPGHTAIIESLSQLRAQYNEIIIPEDVCSHFEIVDVLVGGVSQLDENETHCDATRFKRGTTGTHHEFRSVAEIGHKITFWVQNTSSQPKMFRAVLRGITA